MMHLKAWISGSSSLCRRGAVARALAAGAAAWLLSPAASTGLEESPATNASAGYSQLARLRGHVHVLAQPRFDIGEAPSSLQMGGLELVLAKTAEQKKAFEQLLAAQQNPKSPHYHHWLTPAEYGIRFGASDATIAALSQWLEANDFKVDAPPASRTQLRFHGTKSQVEAAFHTQIHLFDVRGVRHFANVTAPEIPAAFATLITEIRGLHDFYPKPGVRIRRAGPPGAALTMRPDGSPHPQPQITYDGGKVNWVGPTDFATIYNLLPLYRAGVTGSGVTIAIAGQSDIDPTIATAYWTGFGLSGQQFNSINVPAGQGGQDPGRTNDSNESEAFLDVEIAGGLAPGAKILLVRDKNVLTAADYVVQQNLAAVLNISFSDCESNIPAATNQAISGLFQQAVSEGITVTVSTGDNGVAGCDGNVEMQGQLATTGYAVNGIASTPYDLAVGGTDFDPTQPQDWAASNAPGTLANAQAHIPEMVWNDTCANPIGARALGYANPATFCNTATLNGQPNPFIEVFGGGGGLSSCISVNNNVCGGGYAVPSWQKGGVYGIQGFATRALPDVSVIASSWVSCSFDTMPSCDPANQNVDFVAGTSAAAPSVAAIIALVDQAQITPTSPDGRQGLINPALYSLAAAEYGSPQSPSGTLSSCSASLGVNIGAACVFYDVTAGSNAMPCQVSAYNPAGTMPASSCAASSGEANGIMQINSMSQYVAGAGFDLATGLGSINAANLVLAISLPPPTGLTVSPKGQSVNLAWTAEPTASSFNIYQGTQPGQEGSTPVQTGATGTSASVTGLQNGQRYVFTIAAVSALGVSGKSNEAQATIAPAAPTGLSASGGNSSVMLTWTAATGATSYNVYQGTSSGNESAQPVQAGLTGTSSTVTGLANGTSYYFTVVAVDAGGASAPSAEASATPTAPSSGGGALGSLDVELLALLVALRWFMLAASRRLRTNRR
jgi:subtilase family serine protease